MQKTNFLNSCVFLSIEFCEKVVFVTRFEHNWCVSD